MMEASRMLKKFKAQLYPGDYPFGVNVRPARKKWLTEHDLGDGPD